MTISLTSEFEKFIQQQVSSGIYASTSEALDDAYRVMRERDIVRKQRIADLNADIQKGLKSSASGNLISDSELRDHIQKRRQDFLNNV